MRRTALLVSTIFADRAAAPGRRGPGGPADDPVPVPRRPLRGRGPLRLPARRRHLHLGRRRRRPAPTALTERADAPEGAKVLTGTYDISGYGGFTHDFAFAEPAHDWSAQQGHPLLVGGPGQRREGQLRDQGRRRQRRGLRALDDLLHRRLHRLEAVELPFTDFVYRTDYQPVGGIDQILGLTGCGATRHPPRRDRGSPWTAWSCTAGRPIAARVRTTDAAVYPVKEGGTAPSRHARHHRLRPDHRPVTVAYGRPAAPRPGRRLHPVPAGHLPGRYRLRRLPHRRRSPP